jgi:hypothetical protein
MGKAWSDEGGKGRKKREKGATRCNSILRNAMDDNTVK